VMAASGFRTAEIADRIGRTELATRALLCRARGRMRERLDVAGVA
jgi:DNA-directed RNA polymerase specialized sigma24 family protein